MQITQSIDRTPFYYEKLTITSLAVVRLNETYRNDSKAVFITIEDNTIRYRIDEGDPDANDGHLVYASQSLYFADPHSVQELRMIALVAQADAIAIVTFLK